MLSFLLGCGGAGATRPAESPPPPTPSAATRAEHCWLVWLTEHGETSTREVCETSGEHAPGPGLQLSIDGQVISVVARESTVTGARCTGDDYVIDPSRVFTVRQLDAEGPEGTVTLLAPWDSAAPEELEDRIELVASLGPWLAVRRHVTEYDACAARALTLESLLWIDVQTGEELGTAPSDAEWDTIARLVADAGRSRADALPAGTWTNGRAVGSTGAVPRMDDVFPHLGGLVPVRHAGRWTFRREVILEIDEVALWRFELEGPEVPTELSAHAEVPAPVDAFLAAHPEARAAGWTLHE